MRIQSGGRTRTRVRTDRRFASTLLAVLGVCALGGCNSSTSRLTPVKVAGQP